MNVTAASGRCITSLHSHASRLDFAQQHPLDAVFSERSKLRGIRPGEIETGEKVVATEAIKRVGAASWELAKGLWVKIYPRLSKQAGFQDVLLDLTQDPDDEDTRGALRRQLKKLLTEDTGLASELETLLKTAQKPGNTAIASSARSVAIGGNVSGTFINTGDNNRFP